MNRLPYMSGSTTPTGSLVTMLIILSLSSFYFVVIQVEGVH